MKLQTLKDLYVHQLKALYSAEEQILETLPRMIQAAANAQLAAAFQAHLEQTKVQANRLEKLLERHNQSTRGPRDKAMEGVLADSAELLKGQSDQGVRDLGLIAAAQRVEHYEMAGYGSARTYAEMLDDTEGARSLQNTLSEETETDQKLAGVAKSVIKAGTAASMPVPPATLCVLSAKAREQKIFAISDQLPFRHHSILSRK
jgi:ferritin-like metal-binding protein YciE